MLRTRLLHLPDVYSLSLLQGLQSDNVYSDLPIYLMDNGVLRIIRLKQKECKITVALDAERNPQAINRWRVRSTNCSLVCVVS